MHWPPHLSDIESYMPHQRKINEAKAKKLYYKMYDSFCSCIGAKGDLDKRPIMIPNDEALGWLLRDVDKAVVDRFEECAVTALLFSIFSKENKEDLHKHFSAAMYLLACNDICVTFCGDFKGEIRLVRKYKSTKSAELLDTFDEAVGADVIIDIVDDEPTEPAYPERLLKDFEKCSSIEAMLDTVFRYQMLSPEVVRKESAKEAFLTGYKYSLDIGT